MIAIISPRSTAKSTPRNASAPLLRLALKRVHRCVLRALCDSGDDLHARFEVCSLDLGGLAIRNARVYPSDGQLTVVSDVPQRGNISWGIIPETTTTAPQTSDSTPRTRNRIA
jgi:hypothetical protein